MGTLSIEEKTAEEGLQTLARIIARDFISKNAFKENAKSACPEDE
jgi:hypothetical protein